MNGVMIRGAIDRLDSDGAIGWLFGSDYTAPPLVRAFLHHDMIGEGFANGYRADLEEVGFGDGRCGFQIRFDRPIDPSYLPFITVKPQDVDLHLPVAVSAGAYLDLVNAVLTGYAGAGRNRSVLGGLWTDRADAAPLLAGRVSVGATPVELQPVLQELIGNGYLVLHNALAPNGLAARDIANIQVATAPGAAGDQARLKGALSGLGALLFRDPVVRLLRAVFDDQPAIYRLASIGDETAFGQASSFEALPSPAECVALYVGHPDAPVRLDVVRDSHELPEFDATGQSRWTGAGAASLTEFATRAGLSVESLELDALDVAIVGPGLVHRVVATAEAPALLAIAAPRRVTPTRFLSGEGAWTEVGHVSGARIRV